MWGPLSCCLPLPRMRGWPLPNPAGPQGHCQLHLSPRQQEMKAFLLPQRQTCLLGAAPSCGLKSN